MCSVAVVDSDDVVYLPSPPVTEGKDGAEESASNVSDGLSSLASCKSGMAGRAASAQFVVQIVGPPQRKACARQSAGNSL